MRRGGEWYRLEGHTPVPVSFEEFLANPTLKTWCKVDHDYIGDTSISTVFLGLDHGYSDDGPPILFETMVFGGPHDEEQYRYATWDEAVAGHARIVEEVRAADRELRRIMGERIPEPHEE